MKNQSRRAFVRGSTASAVGAVLAAASASSGAAASSSDQQFIDWWNAYLAAEDEHLDAGSAADEVAFTIKSKLPKTPDGLIPSYDWHTPDRWRESVAHAAAEFDAEDRADFLAECDAYAAECHPICEQSGLIRLREIDEAIYDRMMDAAERIITTRAESAVGMAVKLRFILRYKADGCFPMPQHPSDAYSFEHEDADEEDRLLVSLWGDIERLAGLSEEAAPWRLPTHEEEPV